MANFVQSFSQGFDVGNKVIDTMDRRERQKAYDERQKTLQGREDTQWEQQQEAYKHGLERRGIEEKQKDEAHDLSVKSTKQSMSLANAAEARAKKQETRAADEYDYNKKMNQRKEDSAVIQDQYNRALASNDFSWFQGDDAQSIYKRNPQLNPQWITSDAVANAAGRMVNTLNGVANGEMPQWNDPDLLEDANTLFPEISESSDLPQYTKDGKKIVGRKITGIIPMEGGKVAIQMAITDEDGKTYEAPLTQSRTHHDDDNVMVLGMDQLTNRINLVNKASQEDIFKKTSDYLTMSSGKGGKDKTKATLQKELFQAENKITEDYRQQLADLDTNPAYMDDTAAKRARRLEIEKDRDSELAQVRLRASNILGGGIINLEGKQREAALNDTISQFKAAMPDLDFTPEIEGAVREAIENGEDADFISSMLASQLAKQGKTTNTNQSQEEQSSSILSDIVGTPKETSTGGQTTTGGKFYAAGNDIGKKDVVNQAQANMTPYQARPTNQGLMTYNPYGS